MKAKGSAGFTVVELLAIVSILGVLAGVALPRFNEHLAQSRTMRAAADMRVLQNAVDVYIVMYPTPSGATGNDKNSATAMWTALKNKGLLGGIPVAVTGNYYVTREKKSVELKNPYYGYDSSSTSVLFNDGSKEMTFDEYMHDYVTNRTDDVEAGGSS